MRLPSLPKKCLSKLSSIFLVLYVAATLPVFTSSITSLVSIFQGVSLLNKEGKEDEGMAFIRQAIKPHPVDAFVYRVLGESLKQQGKLDEAIATYRQAIKADPRNSFAYFYLGNSLKEQGKLDEVIATYRQAIKVHPNAEWGYKNLGDALTEKGKLDEAISAYRQAIKINPKASETYIYLGYALGEKGKLDEAITAYESAIKINPKSPQTYYFLSVTLNHHNKFNESLFASQKAIELNTQFAINQKDGTHYFYLGDALYNRGKLGEALNAYRQCIQLSENDSRFYDLAAGAYRGVGLVLRKQNKLNEAIAAYRKAIKLEGNQKETSDHYLNIGYILTQQNKLEEALTAYRMAIKLHPDNGCVNPHCIVGGALLDQGKIDKAVVFFRQAIKINPKDSQLYNKLGRALYTQGKVDEAMTAYRQAIKINPQKADGYLNLGYAFQQQGKLKEAIEQLKQAATLDKNKSVYLNEAQRLLAFQQNPQLALVPENLPSVKHDPLSVQKRSVVRIISKDRLGYGTGWVVKRKGLKAWIITNRHIVEEDNRQTSPQGQAIEVEFYSEPPVGKFRKRLPAQIAKITAANDKLDIAVLEVTGIPEDIQPLSISTKNISFKAPICLIGHPDSHPDWSVFTGEVTNQTDIKLELSAITAPGISGSPVLDEQNRVVGLVWGGYYGDTSNKFSQTLAFPMQPVREQLTSWGIY